MASYTMQLREYIEMWSQYETLSTREIIEKGRPKLFDFEYPIFDESYRKVLETHFIRKFYMREIGFETEGLFKFSLETWLIINMPYFNKMFESELLKYDPLTNSKMNVTHKKTNDREQNDNVNATNNGTQSGTSEVTDDNFDRKLESDNPDSRLEITTEDGKGVIRYAKNIKEETENNKTNGTSSATSNSTSNATQNSDINETEDFIQDRFGKVGVQSYPKMVAEFRQSFLRIENQMFDEMQELFMLVY